MIMDFRIFFWPSSRQCRNVCDTYNGFDTLRNKNMQNIFQYVTQHSFNIFELSVMLIYFSFFFFFIYLFIYFYFIFFLFYFILFYLFIFIFFTAWDESYPVRVDIILVGCVMVQMQRVLTNSYFYTSSRGLPNFFKNVWLERYTFALLIYM